MAKSTTRGRQQTALDLEVEAPRPAGLTPLRGIRARYVEGRTEAAVSRSIRAGRKDAADPTLAGAESLARSLARGIDVARENRDVYALAQLGPRLLDVLRELHLTPPARAEGDEGLGKLLSAMSTPE